MNNGQESRIKLESIKSSSTRQKTISITESASTNAWISRRMGVRRVENQLCPCDCMRMFCQNEGSIQRCSGNPHTHCNDWRIDMKQIVPNSVPCSTTSKWLGSSQFQMVWVARSRNHQTQNAQRPQVNVHGRPVYELRHCSVLAKGLIIC